MQAWALRSAKEDGSPHPSTSSTSSTSSISSIASVPSDASLFDRPLGDSERTAEVKVRVHQAFFRSVILSSYENSCCITGLKIPEALVASHIIPWSVDESKRTDPTNGLCLSATWDRLFDRGLITVTPDYRVKVSERLLRSKDETIQRLICAYDGREIVKPGRWWPGKSQMDWHLINIFITKV